MIEFWRIVGGVVLGSFLYELIGLGIQTLVKEAKGKKRSEEQEERPHMTSDAYKGTKNKNPDGTVKNKIGFGELG